MSTRWSYLFVVIFLLVGAGLRLWQLGSLPPGLNAAERVEARIVETARQGRIEVFYDLQGVGAEGLYGVGVAAATALTGPGLLGYRLASVFAGMLTLALTYAVGKRLFGREAGFAALALLAVGLFPILLSRAIGPETLLPLLITALLLALARALPIYDQTVLEPDTTPFAAVGALIGISFYIHPIGFAFSLIAGLLIIVMVIARPPERAPLTRQVFSYLWFALVIAIVLATPYLIASLQQPELAGAGRALSLAGNPLLALLNAIGSLIFVGDASPLYNVPGRPLFDLFSAIFIALGLAAAVTRWRQPRFLVLVIAVLVLLPGLLSSAAPDFLTFAPLLPVLALLFGLGVTTVYRGLPRQPRTARRLLIVAMIALVGFNLQWTARDLFTVWPTLPEVQAAYDARIGAIAVQLDRTAGTVPTVVCTPALTPTPDIDVLTPPQRLNLMMHDRGVHLRYADCGQALIFPDGGAPAQVVFPEASGVGGMYPYLRTWLGRGRPIADTGILPISVAAPLADTIGAFTTTAPVSFAPESPGGAAVTALPVRFGGNLTFLGDVRTWEGTYRPGDFVTLITFWRVDGQLPPDLQLFAHVLSDPAAIAAQADGIGVVPAQLRARDVFIQVMFVQLPATLPAGEYRVSLGAYEAGSRERLAVYDGLEPRGSRLFTGTITVVR